jgi:murein L,D-transpeptidase YafK
MTASDPRGRRRDRAALRIVACAVPLALATVAGPMVSARVAAQEIAGEHGKAGTVHTLADGLDAAALGRRLVERGLSLGSPILIRIFKSESELEVWMRKGERFELVTVYPVCTWSGVLGPKLVEGDKQSPEGFYAVRPRQLHRTGRWRRSLDIGFPNTFDRAHGRTGSYILLHGGCTSIGCYAMTNPVMEEIYALTEAALRQGQQSIPVHVFPFRMTQANLAAHADSEWSGFWGGMRTAYDLFERNRLPPHVRVCNKQYVVSETASAEADGCADKDGEAAGKAARNTLYVAPSLKTASRRRNARQAYAAARATRVAAYVKRRRPHR